MSDAYNRKLVRLAHEVGAELGYSDFLREGVYVVLGGPSFETIAECRMLNSLGADAVGKKRFASWKSLLVRLLLGSVMSENNHA